MTLKSDQGPSPEQIVQVVNGELRIFTEGQKIGITLPARQRPLFMAAIKQEYLKYLREDARVVEAFSWWCDARGIPCVRFEIESDSLDMLSTNDSIARDDPYVRIHFNVSTAGRVFTKAGLVAIVKLLLNHLWDITLSPWEVSAGVLPFSLAHHLLGPVFEIYNTREMTSEHDDSGVAHRDGDPLNPPGRQTVH